MAKVAKGKKKPMSAKAMKKTKGGAVAGVSLAGSVVARRPVVMGK